MSRRAALEVGGALVLAAMLGGCAGWRPSTIPMPTLRDTSPCTTRPETLIVMLPGGASTPDEFTREGFVSEVRKRGIAADIVIADAHPGYYRDKTIVDRLQADVIAPARAQGYTRVWLVGISLGGFGALIYGAAHADEITGIAAIAPYLGKRELVEQIAADGGLRQWQAPAGAIEFGDDRILWRWLQPYAMQPMTEARPELFIGWGRGDRLAAADRVLGDALQPDHVFTTAGVHEWLPWRALWGRMLDAMPIERRLGCWAPR
jgi:pimeloyl-ACP methyl ester carboxylesterase